MQANRKSFDEVSVDSIKHAHRQFKLLITGKRDLIETELCSRNMKVSPLCSTGWWEV